jgi:hypothetical protein
MHEEEEEVFFDSFDNRVRVTESQVIIDKKIYNVSGLKSVEIQKGTGSTMVRNVLFAATAIILFFACTSSTFSFFGYLMAFGLIVFIAAGIARGTLIGNSRLELFGRGGIILGSLSGEEQYIYNAEKAITMAIEEYTYKQQSKAPVKTSSRPEGNFSLPVIHPVESNLYRDTPERKMTQRVPDREPSPQQFQERKMTRKITDKYPSPQEFQERKMTRKITDKDGNSYDADSDFMGKNNPL